MADGTIMTFIFGDTRMNPIQEARDAQDNGANTERLPYEMPRLRELDFKSGTQTGTTDFAETSKFNLGS